MWQNKLLLAEAGGWIAVKDMNEAVDITDGLTAANWTGAMPIQALHTIVFVCKGCKAESHVISSGPRNQRTRNTCASRATRRNA